MREKTYSVSELARASGVTVRTLHHYDEIGLLVPCDRSGAGYRLYSDTDARRLADIMMFRACGIPLAQIAALLDTAGDERTTLLRQALATIDERARTLERQRAVLVKELEAQGMGMALDPDERFEVFGADDPAQYEQEAQERWGETDAYRESQRRVSAYSKEDWLRIGEQGQQVTDEVAACMDAGLPATSERAMDAAEAHRRHIDQWFYPCSYEMQTGLADMYVADERFTATYQKVRPGMAAYLRDAIWANAMRMTG